MPKGAKKRPRPIADDPPVQAMGKPAALVKVVGVSAGGKSTLVRGLRAHGYDARPISQEHSGSPTLWKEFGMPQALIYLDVSLDAQRERRPDVTWSVADRTIEVKRLANARDAADLVIDTSAQTSSEVLKIALAYLQGKRLRKSATPLPPLGESGAPVTTDTE